MPSAPVPLVHVDVASSPDPSEMIQIRDLLEEAQRADGFPGLSDQARLGTEEDPPPGTIVLRARVATTGELAGVATLREGERLWTVESVVRPDRRDDPADVDAALLDAALDEISVHGGGAAGVWLRTPTERGQQDLVDRGLRSSRELLQLRATLPPEAVHDASSPPVPVRPFRPGRDEAAWLEVNARAFARHPDQGSWTLADLQHREQEPWFDPGGFLLHEVGGRLAGFCWTKVHRSPVLGEIYVIGVDPDFRGRGLGRALTRAGLGHLATRGVPTAMLYVESTNTPALVLYRSLGFAEHHREMQFTGDVPASPRQADAPTAPRQADAPTAPRQADAPTARPTP